MFCTFVGDGVETQKDLEDDYYIVSAMSYQKSGEDQWHYMCVYYAKS